MNVVFLVFFCSAVVMIFIFYIMNPDKKIDNHNSQNNTEKRPEHIPDTNINANASGIIDNIISVKKVFFISTITQLFFWIYLFYTGTYSPHAQGGAKYELYGQIPLFLILILIVSILTSLICGYILAIHINNSNEKSFIGLWFKVRKAEMEKRLESVKEKQS